MIELMKTDEELLFAYQRKDDKAALEKLIGRHFPTSYRRAYRILGDPAAADDAVQEALIAMIRGARRFRQGGRFEAWWGRILLNAVRIEIRKLKSKQARDLVVGQERLLRRSRNSAQKDERYHDLQSGLETLSFELKTAVTLHYIEGCSLKEVAAAMDIPPGTASSRVRRGLEQLRGKLKAAGHGTLATGLEKLLPQFGKMAVATPRMPVLATLESLALKATLKAVLAKVAVILFLSIGLLGLTRLSTQKPKPEQKVSQAVASPSEAPPKAPKASPSLPPLKKRPKEPAAETRAAPGSAKGDVPALARPSPIKTAKAPAAGFPAKLPKTLTFLVRDEEGRPRPGATVKFKFPSSKSFKNTQPFSGTTGEDGKVHVPFTVLHVFAHSLSASYENLIGSAPMPGWESREVVIDLRPKDKPIKEGHAALILTMKSKDGPIPHTRFYFELSNFKTRKLLFESKQTDDKGRLFWNDLNNGRHHLEITAKGYSPAKRILFELARGQTLRRDVHLDIGSSLTGVLEVPKGIDPSKVRLKSSCRSNTSLSGSLKNGRYLFENLCSKEHEITASAPGCSDVKAKVAPRESEGPPLVFAFGCELTGRLINSFGEPMANLSLYLKSLDDSLYKAASSDAQGHFNFGGIPPGRYKLTLKLNYRPIFERALDLQRSRELGDLRIAALKRIQALVVDKAGLPVPRARVLVKRVDPKRVNRKTENAFKAKEGCEKLSTDSKGRTEFFLLKGESANVLSSHDSRSSSRSSIPANNQDQELILSLDQNLGSIAGRCV